VLECLPNAEGILAFIYERTRRRMHGCCFARTSAHSAGSSPGELTPIARMALELRRRLLF
jgi:hypothetical protein